MAPDELLKQIAHSLRHEIGPEVAQPFAKTQAFMASVILEKLALQLSLADAHAQAERADLAELTADLHTLDPTPGVLAAVAGGNLGCIVAAVYADRAELGADRFDTLLARLRRTLRARLDRQMAYAA